MNILYLSPRESWPPKSGARLRDFHFAQALAHQIPLVYLYFSGSPDENRMRANLNGAKEVVALPAPKKYTPWKIAKGLLGGRPLPVENYTSPAMITAVEQQIRRTPFGIIHLDSIHLAAYQDVIRRLAPQAKLVLDWHNIESELMQRFARQTPSFSRRYYAEWTCRRLTRLEADFLKSAYGHLVCSERERAQLRRLAPAARVEVIPNGVDTTYFCPRSAVPVLDRLVFVGQMSYHANAEGILWFVREIWPGLRKRWPSLTLSVVGSDPGPSVLALTRPSEIEVTGTVPDVRPFYEGSLAAIVPLQTGGGTRLKVLEGMAAGLPVISTKLGAEGLNLQPGRDFCEVGCEIQDWIDAVELARHPEKRAALTAAAREKVCTKFDWAQIGKRLAQLYLQWGSNSERSSTQ